MSASFKDDQLGPYELRYLIARGGMASVYLGWLPGPAGLGKWVALKVMHPHLAGNERFVRMFLDEARVASNVEHENVCSVIDVGLDEGRKLPYLVMEHLRGEPFTAVLDTSTKSSAPLSTRMAARIVCDIAKGLHAAHELTDDDGKHLDVIHRDISPQNIFVRYDGVAKVLDFGVARLADRMGETRPGEYKGKLCYMSPEQFKNEEIDRRTDIWALGVVLWEVTVGRALFDAHNQGATVYAVLTGDIPRPADEVADYPAALEKIVMRALTRDRDQRYATAAEMSAALESFLASGGERVATEHVGQWMRRTFARRIEKTRVAMLAAYDSPEDVPEQLLLELGDVPTLGDDSKQSSEGAPAQQDTTPLAVGIDGSRRFKKPWVAVAGVSLLLFILLVVGLSFSGGERSGALEQDGSTGAATVAPIVRTSTPDAAVVLTSDASVAASDAGVAAGDGGTVVALVGDGSVEDAAPPSVVAKAPPLGEPTPPTPRRSEPAVGPPGHLSLMVIPAANVYSSGRRLGRSPLFNVKMRPGRHRITLRPIGNSTRGKTITVNIRPGQSLRRSVRLDPR